VGSGTVSAKNEFSKIMNAKEANWWHAFHITQEKFSKPNETYHRSFQRLSRTTSLTNT